MSLDQEKLNQFLQKALGDFGATYHAALVVIGDKLGLYKALANTGPLTPAELAERTGTAERYVREWLAAQAAGGYVMYDPTAGRYSLSEEQAFALADENSPAFMPGAFLAATAAIKAPGMFHGVARFFRPYYAANLVSSWIPALAGVEERLREGIRVADVGCGYGLSTIFMAQAYPHSTFVGFDFHLPSIEQARQAAHEAGVTDRVRFEIAKAKDYPGRGYDFVTFFDCLHDMGDPVGAAAHVRETLSEDGAWMIVEPFASDRLEDNLNLVGRIYYSASTLICTPASLAQEVGLALGAQAGEARLRAVVTAGGFTRFRRATETPFNLVFEARP